MEGPYIPNDVQIEYSMLCNSNNTSYNVSRNFKNGLFCIHTFNYELWNNFGGEISHIVIRFSKFKKRVIRIITSSRMRDSCREVLKKIRNTTLIFSIYLLNINICYKKQTFILYKQSDPQYSHKI